MSGGIAQLFLNLGTRRGVGSASRPGRSTPGKDPVPIVQEAGWASEPVWISAENLAPPGFNPRTFQPVASRYTDYAIPAPGDIHLLLLYALMESARKFFNLHSGTKSFLYICWSHSLLWKVLLYIYRRVQ